MSLKVGLAKKGFDVDAFFDPLEALGNYRPGTYDLLIIDVWMPKMNGFELVREIKKEDPNANVWFLTAFEAYRGEFERTLPDAGVSVVLRKPFSLNALASKIESELDLKVKQLIA